MPTPLPMEDYTVASGMREARMSPKKEGKEKGSRAGKSYAVVCCEPVGSPAMTLLCNWLGSDGFQRLLVDAESSAC